MSYDKEQWFMISAVALFLVGAVFALIGTLAAIAWLLWTGIGFAVLGMVLYIIVIYEQRRFSKKFSPSKAEKEAVEEETVVIAKPAE